MPAQETLRAKIEAHLDAIRALLGGLIEAPDFGEVEVLKNGMVPIGHPDRVDTLRIAEPPSPYPEPMAKVDIGDSLKDCVSKGPAVQAGGANHRWWLLLFNEAGRWSMPVPHNIKVPEMVTRDNLVALLGICGGKGIDGEMSIGLSLDPPLKCDPWPMRAQP